MALGDCGLVGSAAGVIAQTAYEKFRKMSEDTYADTQALIETFNDLTLTPIVTDIPFVFDEDLGVPFAKPTPPAEPDLTYGSITDPGNVNVGNISLPSFDTAPELTATAPTINQPADPGTVTATPPGDAPDVTSPTIPDAPVITLPDEPTLEELTLPSVPTLNLPSFSGTLPALDLTAPSTAFSFTYEDYSAQLPTLIAQVQTMLAGGTGLPDAIWNAIWSKARARGDTTALKAIQEAVDQWAARGFSLPSGVLDKILEGVRQDNQNASNQLSREVAIQQAQMEVENLRFAVTQGIALESLYAQIHQHKQQLGFESAKYAIEAVLALFNAQIAYQNIQLQTYATEAQVYRTRIEAELANVELYRAQLEGQKLIGDINRQAVDLYDARLRSLLTHIEIYKGELEGVRAVIDVNRNEIEAFRAGVEAFSAQVQAHASEVDTYTAKWQGEQIKAQIYNTQVNAFAQRVQAYSTGNDALINRSKLELENRGFQLDRYKTRVAKYSADVDAEARRIAAGVGIYDGQAKMYAAELGAEQARVVADTRQFELGLEESKARADLELKEAQLNIEQLLRVLNLELEQQKTVLAVQAQLTAAAMSAVNIGVSLGEQESNSAQCSTSYNYSY